MMDFLHSFSLYGLGLKFVDHVCAKALPAESVCKACGLRGGRAEDARRMRGGPPGVVSSQSKSLSLLLAWVSAINLTSY